MLTKSSILLFWCWLICATSESSLTKSQRYYFEGSTGQLPATIRTPWRREARAARFHMLIINSGALRQGLGSARKHQNREREREGEREEGVRRDETVRKGNVSIVNKVRRDGDQCLNITYCPEQRWKVHLWSLVLLQSFHFHLSFYFYSTTLHFRWNYYTFYTTTFRSKFYSGYQFFVDHNFTFQNIWWTLFIVKFPLHLKCLCSIVT